MPSRKESTNVFHTTVTLTVEQCGELTRATWDLDGIEDTTGRLRFVLDHIRLAPPASIQRFANYGMFVDLAEGAGYFD